MESLLVQRALLSVTDKTGLVEFAQFLVSHGVELVSTGGTAAMLEKAGLPVTPVSEVTGFPEILGGRVKTLHPKIHAGILASKDNPGHLEILASLDIKPFDLVCVNLYDFASALEARLPLEKLIEEIDIGGPCLLRASAKNYQSILVLPSPVYYKQAMDGLSQTGMHSGLKFRLEMAAKTFAITSAYDAMIAKCLEQYGGANV